MSVSAAAPHNGSHLPVPSRHMEPRLSSPRIPVRDESRLSSGGNSRSSSSSGAARSSVGHVRTRSDAPPRPPPRITATQPQQHPYQQHVPQQTRHALPRSPAVLGMRVGSTPQPRQRTVSNDVAAMPRSASTPSSSALAKPIGTALPHLRQPGYQSAVRRPPVAFRTATLPASASDASIGAAMATMSNHNSSNSSHSPSSSTTRGAPLAVRRANGSASKLPVINTGTSGASSSSNTSSREAAQGRWRDVQWKQQQHMDAPHRSSGEDAPQEMMRSESPTSPADAWVRAPKLRRGSAPDSRDDLVGAHAAAALSPARAGGVLEAVALAPTQLRTSSDRSREPSTSSTVSRLRTISGDSRSRDANSLDIPRRGLSGEPMSPISGTSALARIKAGLMSPKTLIPRSSSGPVRAVPTSQAAAASASDRHPGAIQSFVGAMLPSSMEQRRLRRRASQESVGPTQPRKSHARRSLSTAGFSFGAAPSRTATAKLVISEPTLLEQPFSVDPEMEAIKRSLDPNALGLSTAPHKDLRPTGVVAAADGDATASPAPSIVSSTSFPPGDPRSLWMSSSAPRGPIASPRARPRKMHIESDHHIDELVEVEAAVQRSASETALRRPGPRPLQQPTTFSPGRDAQALPFEPTTPTHNDSPELAAAKLRVRFAGGLRQGSFGSKPLDDIEGSPSQQATPEHGSPASTLGSESLTASPATPAPARLRLGQHVASPRIVLPSPSSRLAHQRFDAVTGEAEAGAEEDAKQQFLRSQPEDANALGLVISAASNAAAEARTNSSGSSDSDVLNSSHDDTIIVHDVHAAYDDDTIVMGDQAKSSSAQPTTTESGRQYEFEVLNGSKANETYILSHRESSELLNRPSEWPLYVLSSVPGSEAGSIHEGNDDDDEDADAQSIVSTSTWGFMGGNYDADGELDLSAANSPEMQHQWPAAREEQTSSSTLVDPSLTAELLADQLDLRIVESSEGKPVRFELSWKALCSSNDGAQSQVVGGRSLLPAAVSDKLFAQLQAGLTSEHLASRQRSLADDFYSLSSTSVSTSLLSVDSAAPTPRSAAEGYSEMERQQLQASEQAERQARREWAFAAPHMRTCSYPTMPGPTLQRSSATVKAPARPSSPPRSPSFLPRPLLLAKSPITTMRRASATDPANVRQASAESLLLSASDSTSSSRAYSSSGASHLSLRNTSKRTTPRPSHLPRLDTGNAPRPPVSSPGGTLGYNSGQPSRLYSTHGSRSTLHRSPGATPRRSPISLADLTPRSAPRPRRSDSMESDLMDTRPPSEVLVSTPLTMSNDSQFVCQSGSSLAAITGAGV